MPDMRICSICRKEFDFEIERFYKEVEGGLLIACSKLCALNYEIVTELTKSCLSSPPEQNIVDREPLFNIHNLN